MDNPPPPLPPAVPPPPPPAKGWWGRNWKWFVPTGCLSLLALFVIFVLFIVTMVFSIIKSSDIYRDSLSRVREDPAVVEALGTPIKDGIFPSGSVNASGGTGDANLSIPISGPKGSGTIYVAAKKSDGGWTYSKFAVEIKQSHERIDLLHNGAKEDEDSDKDENE